MTCDQRRISVLHLAFEDHRRPGPAAAPTGRTRSLAGWPSDTR